MTVPLLVFAGLMVAAGPAHAAPPADFPDLDVYPAVDPAPYQVFGAHPSTSGWMFRTPAGLRCQDSLIPDLGIYCSTPGPEGSMASVSLTHEGVVGPADTGTGADSQPAPILPVGMRFAAGNGVVCAAPTIDTFACRAAKPDSWPADTVDPPDRHYGEHGFVLGRASNWTY